MDHLLDVSFLFETRKYAPVCYPAERVKTKKGKVMVVEEVLFQISKDAM